MLDINFLLTKKGGKLDNANKKEDKKEIEWSKPPKYKVTEDKKKSSDFYSFFNFKRNFTKDATKKMLNNKQTNKNNIQNSKEEILKVIKEQKNRQHNKKTSSQKKIKQEKQLNQSLLTKLLNRFKKNTKIIVNYKNNSEERRKRKNVNLEYDVKIKNKEKRNFEKEKECKKINVNKKEIKKDKKKKKWENSDILKTNLIKGQITFFFNWHRGVVKLLVAIILSFIFITAVYSGLHFWQKQKEAENYKIAQMFIRLREEIKISEKDTKEILVWQKKLNIVRCMLADHIYWTNFFTFLENNTLAEVYFPGGFSGDISGNYTLSAVGLGYDAIYQQVGILRKSEQVIDVSVNSATLSANIDHLDEENAKPQVNFNLELSITPEIFHK